VVYCKDCKFYEKGFDGKPGVCQRLTIADIWNGFDSLESDGVGYSDANYETECSVLYVGENFGCLHWSKI